MFVGDGQHLDGGRARRPRKVVLLGCPRDGLLEREHVITLHARHLTCIVTALSLRSCSDTLSDSSAVLLGLRLVRVGVEGGSLRCHLVSDGLPLSLHLLGELTHRGD